MQGCPPHGGSPFITPLRSPGTGGPPGPPVPGNLTRKGRGEAAMKQILAATALLLAGLSTAQAQVVKDFVDVEGARANKIRGYGVVTGLNGAGDSPRGESARVVRAMLQNLVAPDVAVQELNARNAALVLVAAELAPFQKEGTRLDLSVSVVGDAKSLSGGELQITDLRGPLG